MWKISSCKISEDSFASFILHFKAEVKYFFWNKTFYFTGIFTNCFFIPLKSKKTKILNQMAYWVLHTHTFPAKGFS